MGKKRVHPEFHEYVKGLERIKSDVEKIRRIVESEANVEDRLEDVIPCLKRILERIVYGCLVIQIPVYGKRTSAKRWRNKKASELVREVNPEFYPSPNLDRGVPYIKIANGVRDCDALTKEQWLTAWDFVNQIQHVQNPASDKRKPRRTQVSRQCPEMDPKSSQFAQPSFNHNDGHGILRSGDDASGKSRRPSRSDGAR